MTTKEIFERAKQCGITKYELANEVCKNKNSFRYLYRLQIPTPKQEKTLTKLNNALEKLIKQKEGSNEN